MSALIISQSLLKLMAIESVMLSNHLLLCRPLLLLPSNFPSVRVFSNESTLCISWPKCWSFSFSISLSNEYSGLLSFRIDRLYLLAVQGTLESFPAPQLESIKDMGIWWGVYHSTCQISGSLRDAPRRTRLHSRDPLWPEKLVLATLPMQGEAPRAMPETAALSPRLDVAGRIVV